MLDRRGRLLVAALGFVGLRVTSYDLALHALRSWLDSWPGIGAVAGGMAHQGYDLQLTRYDEQGWRAKFYTSGMEHSPTSATGTAWEPTPWRAVQLAAWEASMFPRGRKSQHAPGVSAAQRHVRQRAGCRCLRCRDGEEMDRRQRLARAFDPPPIRTGFELSGGGTVLA